MAFPSIMLQTFSTKHTVAEMKEKKKGTEKWTQQGGGL